MRKTHRPTINTNNMLEVYSKPLLMSSNNITFDQKYNYH